MDEQQSFATITRHTREVLAGLENHCLQPSDRLQGLGASSVDRAEILSLVLEALALRVARVELFGPTNIGELAALLREKLHG